MSKKRNIKYIRHIQCAQCDNEINIDNLFALMWSDELSKITCSKNCCENIENVLNGYMYNCYSHNDLINLNIQDITEYINKWDDY